MSSSLTFANAPHPCTPAVRTGGLVFMSGLLGVADGVFVPGGVEAETAQALHNVEEELAKHGLGLRDFVTVTIFLADMDDLQLVNEVYSELVPEPRSARSCVAVAKLPFDGRVEIEFVAAVPTEL